MRRGVALVVAVALLVAVPLLGALAGPLAALVRLDDAASPTPPEVRLSSPEDGQGVGASVRVAGTVVAQRGVLDVQVRLDGERWESVALASRGAPAASFSLERAVPPGDHVVEVRAWDGEAFGAPRRAVVRAAAEAPPTVRIVAPADGEGLVAGEVEVRGTVSGEPGGVVRVRAAGVERVATPLWSSEGGAWSVRLPLPSGAHVVEAEGRDERVGLASRVRVAAAEVAPPTVTVAAPAPDTAFGATGDPACAERCVRVSGTVRASSFGSLNVSLDDGPSRPVATASAGAGAWAFALDVPVDALFAGPHVVRLVATDAEGRTGVPAEARFHLRSARELEVTGDDAPRPTLSPLAFRAAFPARWRLDGATIAEGTEATLRLPRPGDHTLLVEAQAPDGSSATRVVPLYAINRAPLVTLGASPAPAAFATLLRAEATDVDGRVVAFLWETGDGQVRTTSTPELRHAYAREGTYRANVTALDDWGAPSARATVLVPVENARPEARFSWWPPAPTLLDEVVFTDESLDPEGTLGSRAWEIEGRAYGDPVVRHRFAARGEHTVTLRFVDADGAAATTTRTLLVGNVPPEASFGVLPEAPINGGETWFVDTSVKPDGLIVDRRWDFGDGSTANGSSVLHVYRAPGTYEVALVVRDDFGARAVARQTLVVGRAPPTVHAVEVDPPRPNATERARFLPVAFDAEADVVELTWDFGDGTVLASAPGETMHAYARSGRYHANVTARDATGLATTLAFIVEVANLAPRVDAFVEDGGFAGYPTRLAARASDGDGRIVRHRFDVDGDGFPECDGPAPECVVVLEGVGPREVVVEAEDDEGALATARLLLDVLAPPSALAPPSVAVETPLPGTLLTGEVLLRGTAWGVRDVVRVDVQLRNGTRTHSAGVEPWTRAEGTAAWRLLLDTRAFPDGAYDLAVRATDAEGAQAVVRVPLALRNGDPAPLLSLALADLAPGDVLEDGAAVHGSAYHPDGAVVVRWRVDDHPWRDAAGDARAFTLTLPSLASGPHTLRVDAFRALHERRIVEVPFVVRGSTPVLRVDVPPGEVVWDVLHAEGRVEGSARVLWRIDHDVWRELPPGPAWTLHELTAGVPGGNHTLSLRAVALDGRSETVPELFPFHLVKVPGAALRAGLEAAPEGRSAPERQVGAGALVALVGAAAGAALGRGFSDPRRR